MRARAILIIRAILLMRALMRARATLSVFSDGFQYREPKIRVKDGFGEDLSNFIRHGWWWWVMDECGGFLGGFWEVFGSFLGGLRKFKEKKIKSFLDDMNKFKSFCGLDGGLLESFPVHIAKGWVAHAVSKHAGSTFNNEDRRIVLIGNDGFSDAFGNAPILGGVSQHADPQCFLLLCVNDGGDVC